MYSDLYIRSRLQQLKIGAKGFLGLVSWASCLGIFTYVGTGTTSGP